MQQWWRTEQPPSGRRRSRPDDSPTTRFERLDRADSGSPEEDRAPATAANRTLVGPWTLLSPGAAAADWTAEQAVSRPGERSGATAYRGEQLTQFTDPGSLDTSHVSAELQQAQTVRLDVQKIAAAASAQATSVESEDGHRLRRAR
jgi:hypothetical protein